MHPAFVGMSLTKQLPRATIKKMLQLKNRVQAQRQARAKLLKAVEGQSNKEEVLRKDEVHKEDKEALKTSRTEEAKMNSVLKDGAKAEEQVKAVLKAGAKAEEQVTSESDYQSTVQAAMEADLRRRARERKMREDFRAKRAERLFEDDSSNTAKIEASMDKVANAVMQPDQLVNAARARQSDGTVCLVPAQAVSATWRCACTCSLSVSHLARPLQMRNRDPWAAMHNTCAHVRSPSARPPSSP
jgi:hypothetical protein